MLIIFQLSRILFGAVKDFIKIDEMYELGLRSLDQKWLVYKGKYEG